MTKPLHGRFELYRIDENHVKTHACTRRVACKSRFRPGDVSKKNCSQGTESLQTGANKSNLEYINVLLG